MFCLGFSKAIITYFCVTPFYEYSAFNIITCNLLEAPYTRLQFSDPMAERDNIPRG